jgi:hypothetical protein
MWDKKFSPSPTAKTSPIKQSRGPVHDQVPMCPECDDAELFEDMVNGQMVCRQCGLCERLLISDAVNLSDMDWKCMSITQKSQHQPARYMTDLIRNFKIDEKLVLELTNRFKAVKFWAKRTRPGGRKSLPSYRKCRCCI